jgi:hypothetical protein
MTAADPGLAELLNAASRYATPEALGLLILSSDPQIRHLQTANHLEVVRSALAEGRRIAADLRSRFGDTPPDGIARALGLTVRESTGDPIRGGVLVYAEYCEKTSEILLFREALRLLWTGLENVTAAHSFKATDLVQMFVAHELYHYVEVAAKQHRSTIARRHCVTVAKLGAWRWHSGLVSLGEIAAGSCAQELLGLDCHPKMFDLIALHQLDVAAARAMVTALGEVAQRL